MASKMPVGNLTVSLVSTMSFTPSRTASRLFFGVVFHVRSARRLWFCVSCGGHKQNVVTAGKMQGQWEEEEAE